MYQKHTWVSKEIIRREYLQNIEDGIYNEQERALEAESALSTSIGDETTRATSKENQLSGSVTTLTNNLTAEVTRSTNKDNEIAGNLTSEVTRAKAAENSLSQNITAITSSVTNETSRATTREDTIAADLASEITRAKAKENTLTTNLSDEVTRATQAESTIRSGLTAYVDNITTGIADTDYIKNSVNLLPNELLPGQTWGTGDGLYYKANMDGSIAVWGTVPVYTEFKIWTFKDIPNDVIGKKVKLSGCPENGDTIGCILCAGNMDAESSTVYADTGNGVEFYWTNKGDNQNVLPYVEVNIDSDFDVPQSDPVIIKPMITIADFPNNDYDHYAPYTASNKELTDISEGLSNTEICTGAVNLLPCDLAYLKTKNTSGTWNDNVYTYNGLTITVNNDGTLKVNGKATQSCFFWCSIVYLKVGKYRISGCPKDSATDKYYLAPTMGEKVDIGRGASFYVSNASNYIPYIWFTANAVTLTNKIFKPMITFEMANSDYDHFVPHVMTNAELAENVKLAVSTVANQGLTTQEKTNARTNIGLGNVGNFKAVSTAANQGLSEAEKANARANIGVTGGGGGGGDSTNFVGTKAEWDSMSASAKAEYTTCDFIDVFYIYEIDTVPTSGSQNLVSSNGIYTYVNQTANQIATQVANQVVNQAITQALNASY